MMEGKRRMVQYDEMGEIKKGPWKAEEDQVLINHVKKYGPRDWSSIRSKGLLRRTGKSCRLRWVNKLRPNLKTGVKFSAEEERTVIDLQAQFGNKWARIATYLPGRTDNDVKNFWSSRQKRLARILHTSATSSHKNTNEVPSLVAPKFSSSTEEEPVAKSKTCSSSHTDNPETIKMLPFQDIVHPSSDIYEHNTLQFDYTPPEQQSHLSFPQIPQLQPDYPMPLEFVTRLGGPSFLDEFEHSSGSALGSTELPIMPSFFGPDRNCGIAGRPESNVAVDIDCMIDDFPSIDMFDHIEPLPSPSKWS